MIAKSCLLACAMVAAPGLALAQPGGAIIDQNRTDRAPPRAPQTRQALPRQSGAPQVAAPTGPAVPLRNVDVQGSTLPHTALATAMQPFLGKPLSQPTIQAAADALAAVYAKSQVALYSIQAPQQDLSGGRLQFVVTEGHIAQVAIHGDVKGKEVGLVKAYGAKLASETPLTRKTMERELSLITDIPGLKTTPQLLQGAKPGEVVLGLGLDSTRRELDLSLLNSGTPQLGRFQVQADLNLYSLLRGGDATRLTVLVPTDIERFQYYSITHSQPIGTDGLRAQGSLGYFRTDPANGAGEGHATVGSLQLSYPLIRSYQQNLFITAEVDGIDSTNAVLGNVPSSERTTTGRAAAAWSLQRPTHTYVVSGVGSYGSTEVGGSSAGIADDTFKKFNLRLGYDQAFGKRWVVRTKAIAQITGDRLPASELASLGGDDFGRAFNQATLQGDELRAASLELAFRPDFGPRPLAGSEVYVFGDSGRVTLAARPGLIPKTEASLGSAGLGVRVAWKQKTVVGLEGAYGVDAPPGKEGAWRLGFTFRTVR